MLPDIWLQGVIIPIYKSASLRSPENYRPITILSCIGKLFTSILNNRLKYFLEIYDVLEQSQTGFRNGYSTSDNIFVLHSIIEILKSSRKNCTVPLLISPWLSIKYGGLVCGKNY